MRLISSLSPRKTALYSEPFRVEFVVGKVRVRQVLTLVLRLLITIIPPLRLTYFSVSYIMYYSTFD